MFTGRLLRDSDKRRIGFQDRRRITGGTAGGDFNAYSCADRNSDTGNSDTCADFNTGTETGLPKRCVKYICAARETKTGAKT